MRANPGVEAWWERRTGFDGYDLFVYRRTQQTGIVQVLQADGSWIDHPHDEVAVVDFAPTLLVPRTALGNIIEATVEWVRDRKPDPGTEAKVLREWLAVEQRRVEQALRP